MEAIKIEALTKKYKDVLAVDRLSLSIQEGELFSLLGVNGAGKTTTIKMLSCLTRPTSGDAYLLGKRITTQAGEVKSIIAVSPQETAVAPGLTVQENLELNKVYDIKEMGARAGHLILYVDNDIISVEEAARIMLDFRSMFDEADIPFYAMDFVLRHPRTEDGKSDDEEIRINDFLYQDIYEEGLADRIEIAIEQTAAYYAMLDQMK